MHICDPQNGYTAITREALSRLDLDHIYPRYGYCNDMLVKLSAVGARVSRYPCRPSTAVRSRKFDTGTIFLQCPGCF